VSERRFAAQLVTEQGDRKYFDDVGCMVLWMHEHATSPPRRSWAYDGAAGRWVDARTARYESGARTPMDFGFAARGGEGGADWNEVREKVLARGARQEGKP